MNRRDCLKYSLMSLVGGSLIEASPLMAATASPRRLVLVELAGANDGLNTLVPIENDHYHRLRPSLSLTENEVIDLAVQDGMSVHRRLKPLMAAWEQGELAWVQGLGYPAPNRSHFKSIALWESGGDGLQQGRRGWLTHDIEHQLGRKVLTVRRGVGSACPVPINGWWIDCRSIHPWLL